MHKEQNLILNFDASLDEFKQQLDMIAQQDGNFSDKIDFLFRGQSAMLPILMEQLRPNTTIDSQKSDHTLKVMNAIKGLESSLYKKREFESREEVDLTHPKFQKALEWVVEGMVMKMQESGIGNDVIQTFVHKFSMHLVGFEENANKKLKGTAFNKLESIENPLVEQFVSTRNAMK